MTIAFYEASVASYLQSLHAVAGFLETGRKYFSEHSIALDEVVETRIHPDMLPFRFQIQSVAHHSIGAVNGFVSGGFRPPHDLPNASYTELQALINSAIETLKALTPDAVNAWAEREVIFDLGQRQLKFTAINFLLSFSLPNLYFHATTAYDILRARGVPLGKRDYLGAMRFER